MFPVSSESTRETITVAASGDSSVSHVEPSRDETVYTANGI